MIFPSVTSLCLMCLKIIKICHPPKPRTAQSPEELDSIVKRVKDNKFNFDIPIDWEGTIE